METPTPVISRKRVTMPRTVRSAANAVGFSGFGITPKAAWRCSPASYEEAHAAQGLVITYGACVDGLDPLIGFVVARHYPAPEQADYGLRERRKVDRPLAEDGDRRAHVVGRIPDSYVGPVDDSADLTFVDQDV